MEQPAGKLDYTKIERAFRVALILGKPTVMQKAFKKAVDRKKQEVKRIQ